MSSVKILVIDDDEMVLEYVRRTLHASGYIPHTALSMDDAWPLFLQIRPAIVLMDVVMPGQDGLAGLKRLKSVLPEMGHNTRFIMLTNKKSRETVAEAILNGAHDYLAKPVRPAQLLEKIKRQLEKI